MSPTCYFRWQIYHLGKEAHPSGVMYAEGLGLARVLQQWWHLNDEPPPSSHGEWRDIPMTQEEPQSCPL